MKNIQAFFLWCAGVHRSIIEATPSEKTKYVGIGATVLFTGILAALSGGYALFSIFDHYLWAVLFAIIWGLVIFNLDRYIVSTMRKEGKLRKELALASPRIILALLISIVIARPLELKFFEKEINREIGIMQLEDKAQKEALIKSRYTKQIDSLNGAIAGLKNEVLIKTSLRDSLRKEARMEADGTGGSKIRNAGPIYQIKKRDAERVERELNALKAENALLITEKRKELQGINSAMQSEIKNIRVGETGPAIRLSALNRLSKNDSAIWLANWFIMLLFIALETAPVLVKLLSPIGPYDHLLKVTEYRFEIDRARDIAVATSEIRQKEDGLFPAEAAFLNDRLNQSLENA